MKFKVSQYKRHFSSLWQQKDPELARSTQLAISVLPQASCVLILEAKRPKKQNSIPSGRDTGTVPGYCLQMPNEFLYSFYRPRCLILWQDQCCFQYYISTVFKSCTMISTFLRCIGYRLVWLLLKGILCFYINFKIFFYLSQ